MKTQLNNKVTNIFNALVEKAGIIEFDNIAYRNKICQIAKDIKASNDFSNKLNYGTLSKYDFSLLTYDFTGIISWLKTLNVYYTKDINSYFEAGILTTKEAEQQNLFIRKDKTVELGTLYIIDNSKENILYTLFHEMCHLYDHSLFKKIWMNDEEYFFEHQIYDINEYDLLTNVDDLKLKDIHNIIIESMYYANFTESHAFMENINFEMFEYLNTIKKEFYAFKENDKFFYRSSKELYGIYILEKLLEKLKYIDDKKKIDYMKTFSNEINKAYYNFSSFDKIINYIYKKLHKIVLHSKVLFDFYYNLDSKAKEIYELDESVKKTFIYSSTNISHRKM